VQARTPTSFSPPPAPAAPPWLPPPAELPEHRGSGVGLNAAQSPPPSTARAPGAGPVPRPQERGAAPPPAPPPAPQGPGPSTRKTRPQLQPPNLGSADKAQALGAQVQTKRTAGSRGQPERDLPSSQLHEACQARAAGLSRGTWTERALLPPPTGTAQQPWILGAQEGAENQRCLYRRHSRSAPPCQAPGRPGTQRTRGRDGRRMGDLRAQHEVGKDSLRPEEAMSGGLESFATGSGHPLRAPEHLRFQAASEPKLTGSPGGFWEHRPEEEINTKSQIKSA